MQILSNTLQSAYQDKNRILLIIVMFLRIQGVFCGILVIFYINV